ncbi:coactosin-like protein [Cloeon dipterum]|uniref:Coactosin-like protein n=1 Tax=Cloeon dipterum TaxID=197152 RepID=A0A8S1CSB6_9INSE|nr:Hypothetical predicted protein [Cloeon dipterum]
MSGKVTMTDEYINEDGPKKVSMATHINRSEIKEAYEDVRSDSTPTDWAVFKFEGSSIKCTVKGEGFDDFRAQFTDDERAFAYLRLQMGDEMSKRKKFLFITWIGPAVGVMKRAKMSTDKAKMKEILANFAVELQLESSAEFEIDFFMEQLIKAGGANYGTGVRDL